MPRLRDAKTRGTRGRPRGRPRGGRQATLHHTVVLSPTESSSDSNPEEPPAPNTIETTLGRGQATLQQRQHKYDLYSHPLKPLQENQEVVFHLNNQWCKEKISRVGPQPRSYIIKAENGREYRKNRLHIKVFKPIQSLNPRTTAEDLFMAPTSSNRTNNPVAQKYLSVSNSFPVVTQTRTPVCNTARTTRTGRTIIPPQRFMDYA
ncbi:hypothetical protein AVEN_19952-1 [Araneus ventricosus]|uniref:Uncharacterized protein n=1 Tax=Araneus ventricosus TaxID=182803 RepID=A0A4Y2LNE9_ARAVE|nr:hypothetical protein AVEN_19952-1 [Araneus ventricosus]